MNFMLEMPMFTCLPYLVTMCRQLGSKADLTTLSNSRLALASTPRILDSYFLLCSSSSPQLQMVFTSSPSCSSPLPTKWKARLNMANTMSRLSTRVLSSRARASRWSVVEVAVPDPRAPSALGAVKSTKRDSSSRYWLKQNYISVGGFRVQTPSRMSKMDEENRLQSMDSMMYAQYLLSSSADRTSPGQSREASNSGDRCFSQQLTPQFLIFSSFWQEQRQASPSTSMSTPSPRVPPWSPQLVIRTLSNMEMERYRVSMGSFRTRWHYIISRTARHLSCCRMAGGAACRAVLKVCQMQYRAFSWSAGKSKPAEGWGHLLLAVLGSGLRVAGSLRADDSMGASYEEVNKECQFYHELYWPGIIIQIGWVIIGMINTGQPLCKKIDNYVFRFDELLGQGNFSKVYKGVNEVTGETVAIKVIELNSLKSEKLEELLFSEIDVLKKLRHPNILKCYEVFTSNRNCYIVTEICNGGDLESKLRKCHHFTEAQAQPYILDVYKGLRYLADNHVIHRDIKVANIFLHNGVAKIADFGFAKFTKQNFKDINIGSPIYMSPEGFIENIYGPKTDVWAFGVFIYELLHGRTPFSHCVNEMDLRREIRTPVSFSTLKPELSFDIKEVIIKCLEIQEDRRITVCELESTPYFAKLLQLDVIPLGGRKNNILSVPVSQQKALTPNHTSFNRVQVKNGNGSLNGSLEKNQVGNNSYGSIQKRGLKFSSEQTILTPQYSNQGGNSPLLPNDFPHSYRHNSTEKTNVVGGLQKETPQVMGSPKLMPSKPRVDSAYMAVKGPSGSLLGGLGGFKEAVNCLHYCRLIYKYIMLSREVEESNRKFISILAAVMFRILDEVSGKIERKEIGYDSETTRKESKLREVSGEYLRKYSADIERPFNCEPSYEAMLTELRYKIKYFESLYLSKAGTSTYLHLLHFLLVLLESTELLRKCAGEQRFGDWSEYRHVESFLSQNKGAMNYQSYLDLKMKIIKP